MALKQYLSNADLVLLAQRIAAVFETKSDLATTLASYYTSAQTDSAIASAIAGVTQFDYEIVNELPQEGEKGVIYLVPNSGSGENIYDEYIWIVSGDPATGHFELFGTQMIELVDYIGSGTITITDGTGADAGKKVIGVKFDNVDFVVDPTNGLQLSSARKASLDLADTAIQSVASSDLSVLATLSGTSVDLSVAEITASTINALWS